MRDTQTRTITIDMDKRCAECGKPGAVGSGICLRCTVNAMDAKTAMKSRQGKAVQARYAAKIAEWVGK